MRYSMMKKSAGNMMIGNGNSCLVAKERIKDMMKEKDREKNKEVNKMKEREDMEKYPHIAIVNTVEELKKFVYERVDRF